jgi:hypothetical protein
MQINVEAELPDNFTVIASGCHSDISWVTCRSAQNGVENVKREILAKLPISDGCQNSRLHSSCKMAKSSEAYGLQEMPLIPCIIYFESLSTKSTLDGTQTSLHAVCPM